MRFDTHRISAYLVEMLKWAAPVREVIEDGGDIIQLALRSGETVNIYLIESALSLHEISVIIQANEDDGIFTLFILWCDLLLPAHGQAFRSHDWMAALLALYGDKIYAYDAFGPDLFIFPVYFDTQAGGYVTRYGTTVDAATLHCETMYSNAAGFDGYWRVAAFGGERYEYGAGETKTQHTGSMTAQAYYAVLGIEVGATREDAKRAYRFLARRYHPDVNGLPEANDMMQQINEAYERVIEYMDEQEAE
jgi:hypothetical protein